MVYNLHSTSKQQRLIEVFQPEKGKSINKCIVLFPGGGYTQIAWDTQILTAAAFLNKLGITVVGLKYRVLNKTQDLYTKVESAWGSEHYWCYSDVVLEESLHDAIKSIQFIITNKENLNIKDIILGGYSAGSNLVLRLLDYPEILKHLNFIFCVSTWHFGKTQYDFNFKNLNIPIYFVHHKDDIPAPINLVDYIIKNINAPYVVYKSDYKTLNAHTSFDIVENNKTTSEWLINMIDWAKENNYF